MKKIFNELKEITGLPGISGHEDRVIQYLYEKLQKYTDEIIVDYSGNLTATFRGTKSEQKHLLIFGHMDEVGLMVRKITEEGYLLFERMGGVSEKTLRSQLVDVFSIDGNKSYSGVVGTKSHHFTQDDEKLTVPNKFQMYIDMGASSKQEVLNMGVNIGSVITYKPNFTQIGNNRIASKALDNRVACYMLLKVAEYLSETPPKINVSLGFSVQEEFNLRGSLPMIHRLMPNMVISLDCAVACDTPDLNMLYDISLGKGPVISQMNTYGKGPTGGLIPTPKFRAYIEEIAKTNDIKFQREVVTGVLSDASFVQMKGEFGIIVAHIGFPIRYSHSPIEVADINDITQCIKLLNLITKNLDEKTEFNRLKK